MFFFRALLKYPLIFGSGAGTYHFATAPDVNLEYNDIKTDSFKKYIGNYFNLLTLPNFRLKQF